MWLNRRFMGKVRRWHKYTIYKLSQLYRTLQSMPNSLLRGSSGRRHSLLRPIDFQVISLVDGVVLFSRLIIHHAWVQAHTRQSTCLVGHCTTKLMMNRVTVNRQTVGIAHDRQAGWGATGETWVSARSQATDFGWQTHALVMPVVVAMVFAIQMIRVGQIVAEKHKKGMQLQQPTF